nr:efflux transporter periplasmic adaptor subunit [Bacteroidota bacterium]
MKKILRYAFFALMAFAFVWTLWFLYQKSVDEPEVFKIETPTRGNIVKKTIANGSIEPRQEI